MTLTGTMAGTVALIVAASGSHGLPQRSTPAQAPPRVTIEMLKGLKSTSNDPAGDQFGGSREALTQVVDAIVNDSSLVSPMYLFLASKTAFNLNRVADAAFLFYAAQLRTAFDFERLSAADPRADGNNAATYLGFLRQTIGGSVNPAIMREPKQFAAVMDRLDAWPLVPAREAYYPEFDTAKGFKVPPERWADTAATIKNGFMTQFGRRQARLLNDAEYFEAFRFVQSMNFGELPATPDNRDRLQKDMATMKAAEARLFPPAPPTTTPAQAPVRVGGTIPDPRVLRRVEPEFPPGATGSVILEVTIGTDGKVEDVRFLRNVPALDAAAEKAVRQWLFEVTTINGRAVPAIKTVAFSAKDPGTTGTNSTTGTRG